MVVNKRTQSEARREVVGGRLYKQSQLALVPVCEENALRRHCKRAAVPNKANLAMAPDNGRGATSRARQFQQANCAKQTQFCPEHREGQVLCG